MCHTCLSRRSFLTLAAAGWLLKNRGRFCMIHLAERLPELVREMSARQIEPKRLRMIHPRRHDPARMVLIEGRKDGKPGLEVEAPLYVYRGSGRDYTEEVLAIYGLEERPVKGLGSQNQREVFDPRG